jgi:hypothetical protein
MTADEDAAMVLGRAAHAKLNHGFEIRDRLRDLLAELGSAERPVRREDNARSRTRMVKAQWILEGAPDYSQAALLMGDFIHNLRAAMDYAVWAVTPVEVREATPTKVAFPLYSKRGKWTGWSNDRQNWYGSKVFSVMEGYQPFNAGEHQFAETADAAAATERMVASTHGADDDTGDSWAAFAGILESEYLSGVNPQLRDLFGGAVGGEYEDPVEFHRRFRIVAGMLTRADVVIGLLAGASRRQF